MPSKQMIDEFLGLRRIAVVGVSRRSQEYANIVYRKLLSEGYTLYPVNPQAEQVEGVRCYPSVTALPEAVDGALVLLPAGKCAAVVQECLAVGIGRVWFRVVDDEAARVAQQAGMKVVNGACPLMFFGGFPHNVHRFFAKLEA